MIAQIIDDAIGSVCRKTVKICAATAATATDNIATAYREIADCFDRHGGGLDFDSGFPRPAYVLIQTNAAEKY
jgi:hypothetical protein